MKVINVAIDFKFLTQFQALPKRFEDELTNTVYCIHGIDTKDESLIQINGSELVSAYDLHILHTWNDLDHVSTSSLTKTVYLNRYDKAKQAVVLNHVLGKLDLYGYKELATSFINFIGVSRLHYSLDKWTSNKFVVKPTAGARSMGVITGDLAQTNLRAFLTKLCTFIKKKEDERTNEELIEICNTFNVKLELGAEREENETAKSIGYQGLILQEFVETSFEEIRVILGGDKPYFLTREHKDGDLNVYSRVIDRPEFEVIYGKAIFESIYSAMFYLTDHVKHGSVDLWISQSPTATKWGIFEFQPQYGHDHVPDDLNFKILTQFIKDASNSVNV